MKREKYNSYLLSDCIQLTMDDVLPFLTVNINMHKHTFLNKNIIQRNKKYTDLPTLIFTDCYRKQTLIKVSK